MMVIRIRTARSPPSRISKLSSIASGTAKAIGAGMLAGRQLQASVLLL